MVAARSMPPHFHPAMQPTLSSKHHWESNRFQSLLLIVALLVLVAFSAWILFGSMGVYLSLAFTLSGLFFARKATTAMVMKMYKAQPIQRHQSPQLYDTFVALCQRAELAPIPTLYYIPSKMANAFAVGEGDSAAVGVTDGIIRMMDHREMAGILAHEITHIRCRDTSTMGVADVISRSVAMVARIGFFMMLFSASTFLMGRDGFNLLLSAAVMMGSPMVGTMLQLALSRTREFNADRGAALLTGDITGLSTALQKLEHQRPRGLFDMIFRPGNRRKQPNMLRTHPPTEDRIAALKELSQQPPEIAAPVNQIAPLGATQFTIEEKPEVRAKPKYHWATGLWW
jgi:heat shock protein HtpX